MVSSRRRSWSILAQPVGSARPRKSLDIKIHEIERCARSRRAQLRDSACCRGLQRPVSSSTCPSAARRRSIAPDAGSALGAFQPIASTSARVRRSARNSSHSSPSVSIGSSRAYASTSLRYSIRRSASSSPARQPCTRRPPAARRPTSAPGSTGASARSIVGSRSFRSPTTRTPDAFDRLDHLLAALAHPLQVLLAERDLGSGWREPPARACRRVLERELVVAARSSPAVRRLSRRSSSAECAAERRIARGGWVQLGQIDTDDDPKRSASTLGGLPCGGTVTTVMCSSGTTADQRCTIAGDVLLAPELAAVVPRGGCRRDLTLLRKSFHVTVCRLRVTVCHCDGITRPRSRAVMMTSHLGRLSASTTTPICSGRRSPQAARWRSGHRRRGPGSWLPASSTRHAARFATAAAQQVVDAPKLSRRGRPGKPWPRNASRFSRTGPGCTSSRTSSSRYAGRPSSPWPKA